MSSPGVKVVLGIDAAWTAGQPSGVALAVGAAGNWRLVAVAPSYQDFYRRSELMHQGSVFDAKQLLMAAADLAGLPVTLVAADIPLAHSPITKRRPSDNAISRAYGGRYAGTHSPSALRPGRLADDTRAAFLAEGYALQTQSPVSSGLIEVYPHPALIEMTGAAQRLPYKIGKVGRYWRDLQPAERRAELLGIWRGVVAALDRQIAGTSQALPLPPIDGSIRQLKAFEDMLDAVVCAWVGARVLDGHATAHGDDDSAIWVPVPPRKSTSKSREN